MPLFGSRMVCETANYKHIQKRKQEMEERENKLAVWYKEKAERKEKLRLARERLRQGSVSSTGSTISVRDESHEVLDQGNGHQIDAEKGSPVNVNNETKDDVGSKPDVSEVCAPDNHHGSPNEDKKHIVGDGAKSDGLLCGDCIVQ